MAGRNRRNACGSGMAQARNCPDCGSPMESGSVAAESITGGAKWHKSRSVLALGGESIGDYTTGGMVWFDGARCRACRLLVLRS